jgi:hypothetical protein
MAFWLVGAVTAVGGAAACRKQGAAPPADAGRDGAAEGRSALSLDIAVTGCASFDDDTPRCTGPAPLVLSFAPVGSPEFTRFIWQFDDGTPASTDRSPVHQYALPASYEVTVIGAGDVGNISGNRVLKVVVEPVGLGRPCDVDAQCGGALRCACTPGSGCPPAFIRGVCTTACDTAPCEPGGACALLGFESPAPPGDGAAAARQASCLGGCQTSADCATGFVCQPLPAGAHDDDRWVRACVPLGALGGPGAPCRSASGVLDDAVCATGTCADLGALGSCSAVCDADQRCPDATACARMPDGRQLCLVDCATSDSCTRDPLLACSAPASADGGAGYQADAAPGVTYCAPKACVGDADCAPAGRCGPGARCVRS